MLFLVLLLETVSRLGFELLELCLGLLQSISCIFELVALVLQRVDGLGVCVVDLVDLLVFDPHGSKEFACQCHGVRSISSDSGAHASAPYCIALCFAHLM